MKSALLGPHLGGGGLGLFWAVLGDSVGAGAAVGRQPPHGLRCCGAGVGAGAAQHQHAGAKHGLGEGGQGGALEQARGLRVCRGRRRGRLHPRERHLPRKRAAAGRRHEAVAQAGQGVGLAGPQLRQQLGDGAVAVRGRAKAAAQAALGAVVLHNAHHTPVLHDGVGAAGDAGHAGVLLQGGEETAGGKRAAEAPRKAVAQGRPRAAWLRFPGRHDTLLGLEGPKLAVRGCARPG